MDQLISVFEGVTLTPLKIIEREKGNIMHGLKNTESSFSTFGEAYFTFVKHKAVKGWKKHTEMTLNLIVPLGKVRFIIYDNRQNSITNGQFLDLHLSRQNYQRLTLEPGLWFAFQGLNLGENMILNIGNIKHNPAETINKKLDSIPFNWSI